MHSELQENLDIDEIFETYKERDDATPRIDVIIEHYLSPETLTFRSSSTILCDRPFRYARSCCRRR